MDPDDFVAAARTAPAAFRSWWRGRGRCSISSSRTPAVHDASVPGQVRGAGTRSRRCWSRVKRPTARELYAAQLAGVLGLTAGQVERALQEARGRAPRAAARTAEPASAPVAAAGATARCVARSPTGPAGGPTEPAARRAGGAGVLATNPELLRTARKPRAPATCWSTPAMRQLHRGRRRAGPARPGRWTCRPGWTPDRRRHARSPVVDAMMDDGLAGVADPAGRLRTLIVPA